MRLSRQLFVVIPFIVILAGHLVSARSATAGDDVVGDLVLFNDNAAWSWFEDERAIVDAANGKILVSSVGDASGPGGASRNGDIDVASLDIASGIVTRFVLRDSLQDDDHNSAALWQRPDGRYVAMYGTHLADNLSRWRVSNVDGDISSWTAEQSLNNGAAMTYSNVHFLPNDNSGAGRLYNFVRSIGFDPNILVSSDHGTTWSYGGRLLNEGGNSDRPYVRYFSDGDRIHFIATERHPRNFDNSIYHGYVQNGQIFNSAGAVIDVNLFDATAVAPAALTRVFNTGTVVNGAAMQRGWTVDVAVDGTGNPVAVFQARANGADTDHRFFYGRWTGSAWNVNQMAFAGSYLYAAENDYTGLVSIDPNDEDTVFLSSEVHPATKAQLFGADGRRHYELFRGTTSDSGASWSWTPLTYNSTVDNVRPLVPKWDADNTAVLWMRGSYSTYQDYNMRAVGLVNPDAQGLAMALAVDFGATGQTVHSAYQAFTRSADPPGNEQTQSFASSFAGTGGQIAVTLGGGDVVFADRGNDVAGPLGALAEDLALLNGDITLTLGNLSMGRYQLVLYSHDRNVDQGATDIRLNGVRVGGFDPSTGASPTIGVASSRIGFSTKGVSDLVFTLDSIVAGGQTGLNGFELYYVDDVVLPLVDLNGDDDLNILDVHAFAAGMHTNLSGLPAADAYARGDLNGDFQNGFADFQIFRSAYELWNGAGSFASAMAGVPEPSTFGLLAVGFLATCRYSRTIRPNH